MPKLLHKTKKKTIFSAKNIGKCGEINFCLQLDTRVYVLRCLFCHQICIQWESFISHMEEEHDEELRSDHLLQQEIEEVSVEDDISKQKTATKQSLLEELPESSQMSIRSEYDDDTSIEELLDYSDPLEEIETEKCKSIRTTVKAEKNGFPAKSLDSRIVNEPTLEQSYDNIEDQILHNQRVLRNGLNSIVANQQEIATKLEKFEASIVSKPEMMAQSKLLMECKVAIKNVEASVCRMTGDDKNLDEVASMLPFQTIEAVEEAEQKLGTPDFAQAMKTYLHNLKGASKDVGSVIRPMFTDNLLDKYNWDGRCEKHALGKLMLFNKTLREVFQHQGAIDFEKSVKKAVERSHHRMKQKIYLKKNCK